MPTANVFVWVCLIIFVSFLISSSFVFLGASLYGAGNNNNNNNNNTKSQDTNEKEQDVKKKNARTNNNNKNNGDQDIKLIQSPNPVSGQPYSLPAVKTVYFPNGKADLSAKFTDPATKRTYKKAASPYDVFNNASTIYTTYRVHGPRDIWFVVSSLKTCKDITYSSPAKAPPRYTEKNFEAQVPKMRQLLERVSNGHVTFGTVKISAMDLKCTKPVDDLSTWCGGEVNNWTKQASVALGIPAKTHTAVYIGPINQCYASGMANKKCGSRCGIMIASDAAENLVHELLHNFGASHANNAADKEYGDETCIMGHGNELLNAAHTYMNGWLDDAEFLELESVCSKANNNNNNNNKGIEVTLRNDTKHGLVLYLAAVVKSTFRYQPFYDLMLLPFCVLSYRIYNNNKKKRVLVHQFNAAKTFPPVSWDLYSPTTNLMANLDAVGSSYVLDTAKAQAVPLAYFTSWNAKLQEIVVPESESVMKLLGFTEFSRRAMSKLTITVVSKDSEKAVVRLKP
jgi:Gametolysin peptidase M11